MKFDKVLLNPASQKWLSEHLKQRGDDRALGFLSLGGCAVSVNPMLPDKTIVLMDGNHILAVVTFMNMEDPTK